MPSADFDAAVKNAAQWRDGQALGVTGTPSFFVNGRFLSGAQPYAYLEQAVRQVLAEGADAQPAPAPKPTHSIGLQLMLAPPPSDAGGTGASRVGGPPSVTRALANP